VLGQSPEKVAEAYNFDRSCIYRWLKQYDGGGFEALESHMPRGSSSRPVPLNEVCSIHLTTLFFLLVRLTARGYYVIANSFAGIIDCHQAPHRTVLALLTHTAPHQNRFTELE
jgi:hypothetical protein